MRSKILFLAILIAGFMTLPQVAYAQLSKDLRNTVTLEFSKANEQYKRGEFAQAAETYEAILGRGVASGAVYFNLGNSYYKIGKLGKALVNYERAQRLLPRDADVHFNQRYAHQKIAGTTPPLSMNFIDRLLLGHINFYSVNEMTAIIFILLIAWGGIFNLAFHFQWNRQSRFILLLIILFLVTIFSAGLIAKIAQDTDQAIVIQKAPANFEPRPESTIHYQMPEGVKVKVLKIENGWAKIQRGDGKLGWVRIENLEMI